MSGEQRKQKVSKRFRDQIHHVLYQCEQGHGLNSENCCTVILFLRIAMLKVSGTNNYYTHALTEISNQNPY
jgi:hypothetical protein